MKPQTWIVLPDPHISASGDHDERSLTAVENYISDRGFDGIICLGDFLDFGIISSHNKGKPKLVEGGRIEAEYAAGNRVLDRWQKLVPKVVLIEGNHDWRMEAYIEAHPEAQGLLEVERGLELKRRKIQWVRFWRDGEVYRMGNATFGHGRYTNDMHTKKNVLAYQTNYFSGHTHDVQCYSMVTLGDNRTLVGQTLGCLCKYSPPYMSGRPNKWQQAFGEFHFWGNDFFNYTVSMLFDHQFVSPTGRRYKG